MSELAGGSIELHFRTPPSVNALWVYAGAGKRVRSNAYRKWRTEAGWEIHAQKPARLTGPFNATIHLPAGLKGDTDNYSKATFDLLQELGVIENDRLLRDLSVKRGAERFSVVLEAA